MSDDPPDDSDTDSADADATEEWPVPEVDPEADHPVPTEDVTPEDRARALHSLLEEQGLVSTDAIDGVVSVYEEEVGPMNGAEVVARAWTDPDYREWLLSDGTAAIEELGHTGAQGVDIEVCENTDDTHHVVVCTLCSCYPWPVLGLPPTWYKSPPYRSKIVKRPRRTLREAFDLALPDAVDIEVWDSSSEVRYMVLPQRPPGTEEMTEEELADLVTRDAMIGVERLAGPGADAAADGGAVRDPGAGAGDAIDDVLGRLRSLRDADPPTDAGDPSFAAPWQARAFALTVTLRRDGAVPWDAFQERLIAAVERLEESGDGSDRRYREADYYRCWLAATERLLTDAGVLAPTAIHDRATEFAAGERDTAEFVVGEHGHDHGHHHGDGGHGHDHSHH